MTIRGNVASEKFYVIGISFEKADAETRGKFTFFPEAVQEMVNESKAKGLGEGFIISTCNRTEYYGFAASAQDMIDLFCQYTEGSVEEFMPYVQIKEGKDAVEHLFRVSSGLESQILGDFDIIGQIKIWFKRFRNAGNTNAFLERLFTTAIQISKKVKNETRLSNGIASVSYAAVNFIQNTQAPLKEKRILLFGIGKIGRNTCANLIKHTQNAKITLINRTREKADILSEKFEVEVKDFSELENELAQTDVLIVATGSHKHTVTERMIPFDKKMTIIDMSVPENVSHTLGSRENIQLINVDSLSKLVDDNLSIRKAEVPAAEEIISTSMEEFNEWLQGRELVPVILSFKERLEFLQQFELQNLKKENANIDLADVALADKLVQKLTNQFASYLHENKGEANQTIELLTRMFSLKESSVVSERHLNGIA